MVFKYVTTYEHKYITIYVNIQYILLWINTYNRKRHLVKIQQVNIKGLLLEAFNKKPGVLLQEKL